MRSIVRVLDWLSWLFAVLSAMTIVVLVVLMLYDVLMRYAFNAPTTWGNDLNTFLMGGAFVMSIAYALATDAHVRVDLLYNEENRHRLGYVDLIGFLFLVLPIVAWITWGLYGYMVEAIVSGERTGSGGWNPVVWPFRVVLFVGFVILMLQVVAEILKRFAIIIGRPIEGTMFTDAKV